MVNQSLFYVNYVHGFVFSMPTNENCIYAKKFFIGLHAESPKKSWVYAEDHGMHPGFFIRVFSVFVI